MQCHHISGNIHIRNCLHYEYHEELNATEEAKNQLPISLSQCYEWYS